MTGREQVTTGMVGGGFYDANSAPQMAAIAHVLPWLDTVAAELPLPDPGGVLRLADFGCSEGRNSIALMRRLVNGLRARSGASIQTLHSDLPTNDFSHLFRSLGDAFDEEGVYSAAVGGSMFDQVMPSASLQVATTFNAIGFLSRRPLERLEGYILPNGGSRLRGGGAVSDADRQVFAVQAEADMAAFLRARAAELCPGGRLLVQVFGANDEARTCDGIYDVLNDAVLALVGEGRIDRETYDRYYQPVYFRTLPELLSPLEGPLSVQFRVARAESYEVAVPFVEEWRRTGDIDTYARAYVAFFRAFTEAPLAAALSGLADGAALVAEVFARAEALVRADPDLYPFRYVAVAALLERTGA